MGIFRKLAIMAIGTLPATVGTGIFISDQIYDRMAAKASRHLDNEIRLVFTKNEKDSSLFMRKGTFSVYNKDTLVHSFDTISILYPFVVKTEFSPKAEDTLKVFTESRLAPPVLSVSPLELSLTITPAENTSALIPLGIGFGDTCTLTDAEFVAYADGYMVNPDADYKPSDIMVRANSDRVLCQDSNQKDGIYMEKAELLSALHYFVDEDGPTLPYFASISLGKAQFNVGQNEFTLKNVSLNHQPGMKEQKQIENFFLNFYVGSQGSLSSVRLEGYNDMLWKQEMRDGHKRGEYKLSLEGPVFNNKEQKAMVGFVEEGYLKVDGKKLVSDIVFDVDLQQDSINSFTVTANGIKSDLNDLLMFGMTHGMGFPSRRSAPVSSDSSSIFGPQLQRDKKNVTPMPVISDSTESSLTGESDERAD